MRMHYRWRLVLAFVVVAGGLPLFARSAVASPLVCPTESCSDQCYSDCWQPDCKRPYCDDIGCYDNLNEWHQYDTGCDGLT